MKRNFVLFVFLRSIRISNMKVVCAYLCEFVLLYSFFVHSENESATFALRKRLFCTLKEALLKSYFQALDYQFVMRVIFVREYTFVNRIYMQVVEYQKLKLYKAFVACSYIKLLLVRLICFSIARRAVHFKCKIMQKKSVFNKIFLIHIKKIDNFAV